MTTEFIQGRMKAMAWWYSLDKNSSSFKDMMQKFHPGRVWSTLTGSEIEAMWIVETDQEINESTGAPLSAAEKVYNTLVTLVNNPINGKLMEEFLNEIKNKQI